MNSNFAELCLGYYPGAAGNYTLSQSAQLSPGVLYIANYGRGAFVQTGGTNNLTQSSCYLGYAVGASGTYSMSGGLVEEGDQFVGYGGVGCFIQTGGSNGVGNSSSAFYLAFEPGSRGNYTLSGSGYLNAGGDGLEVIGYSGTGSFTQSGGTNVVQYGNFSSVFVGYAAGSYGSYALGGSGVQAIAGNLEVGHDAGSSGTYRYERQLQPCRDRRGHRRPRHGDIYKSGGTNSAGAISLASNPGGSGVYNLNGGVLIVTSVTPGPGMAAFNFGGGTLQAALPSPRARP